MSKTMFPHVVTIYTITEDPVTFAAERNITVLRGVLLDAAKAVNVRTSGLVSADSVNLYIPFGVDAFDGISLLPKAYARPKQYRDTADKSGVWTLDSENTFFVKGEVVEPDRDFNYINQNYDNVHRITSVDEKDFGSLKHWEVGGS